MTVVTLLMHAAVERLEARVCVRNPSHRLAPTRPARRPTAVPVLPPLPPPLMPPLPPPARALRTAAPHAVEGTKVYETPHALKLVVAADATGAASAAGACTRVGAALRGGLGETKVHW